MTNGLIGRKLGMTRVFSEDGTAVPVTIVQAGPCQVVVERDKAVQLGFGLLKKNRTLKAELGHAKKAGFAAAPHVVRSFTLVGDAPAPAAEVTVQFFAQGELVN